MSHEVVLGIRLVKRFAQGLGYHVAEEGGVERVTRFVAGNDRWRTYH